MPRKKKESTRRNLSSDEDEYEEESDEDEDDEDEYIMNEEEPSSDDDDDEDWNVNSTRSRAKPKAQKKKPVSKSRAVARRQPGRTTKAQARDNKPVYAEDEDEDEESELDEGLLEDDNSENDASFDSDQLNDDDEVASSDSSVSSKREIPKIYKKNQFQGDTVGNSKTQEKRKTKRNDNVQYDSLSESSDSSSSSQSSSQSSSSDSSDKRPKHSRSHKQIKGKKLRAKKQKKATTPKESKFVLLEYDEGEILSSEEDKDDDFHVSDSASESMDSLELDEENEDNIQKVSCSRQSLRSRKKPDYFNYSDDEEKGKNDNSRKTETQSTKRKRTKPDRFNYSDDEKDRDHKKKNKLERKESSTAETIKLVSNQVHSDNEFKKSQTHNDHANISSNTSSKKVTDDTYEESHSDNSSYEKGDELYHDKSSSSSSESDFDKEDDDFKQHISKRKSNRNVQKKHNSDAKTEAYISKSKEEAGFNNISKETTRGTSKIGKSQLTHVDHGFSMCSSTVDEMTKNALPRVHVCFICARGGKRQCFDLKTIYRASLMSASRKYKKDGNLALVQPPHFREEMNFDLLDQIVSRFGKSALTIENTDVFKNEEQFLNRRNEYDDIMDMSNPDKREGPEIFRARFEQYLLNQMGKSDILCCPICFTEAFRRLRSYREDDDDDDDEDYGELDEFLLDKEKGIIGAYKVDPMTILGSLDDEEFQIASSIAFNNIVDLKLHLSYCHQVNTSIKNSEDFFQNFKIRANDGLLEKHLKAYWQKMNTHGAKRRYWEEGHNQSYIYLRGLIENKEKCPDAFSTSFPNRAKKIWDRLVATHQNSR